jgi:thiamine-phosphate pyrophosphorylase
MDLTPAVYRALARANSLAKVWPEWSATGRLLRAFLEEEEGAAPALLIQFGFNLPNYLAESPWPAGLEPNPAPENSADEAEIRRSWGRILRRAKYTAKEMGDPGEISSQHFIASFFNDPAEIDPYIQALSSHGLKVTDLAASLQPKSTLVVQMDEQLFNPTDPSPTDPNPALGLIQKSFSNPSANQMNISVARLMDATANRAREGLRVVEDHARFTLNSLALTGSLKEIRHGLREALALLPADWITNGLRFRDVDGDVGAAISTPQEMSRSSPHDVAMANLKRVQESLRSLEEHGKLISAPAAAKLESLRYRSYSVEKLLGSLSSPSLRLLNSRLYLLVSAGDCALGLENTTRKALEGGVDMIQSREKGLADREWLKQLESLRKWTEVAGALLIVNDRPDLALLAGADGVHTGQDDLPIQACRRIIHSGKREALVGASTHTHEQLITAIREGADHAGVGPIFPSSTKQFDSFPGINLVRSVSQTTEVPWFALGGISPDNLEKVLEAGARRVAVSRCVLASHDPARVSQALKTGLNRFGH